MILSLPSHLKVLFLKMVLLGIYAVIIVLLPFLLYMVIIMDVALSIPAIIIRCCIYVYVIFLGFLLDRFLFILYIDLGGYMQLNIYTVFNRIDGRCDGLFLNRSDSRVAFDFASQVGQRNRELESKKFPPISLDEYELRKVGLFEDTTGEVTSLSPVVIPFN